MSERATILARWNHGPNEGGLCYFPFFPYEPEGLNERTEWVSTYMGGFIPLAWIPYGVRLTGSLPQMLKSATAAGRLIEFVDGKYVARGIEQTRPQHEPASCEEEKPALSLGAILRQVLERQKTVPALNTTEAERKRAPLPYFTEAKRFDAWKGFFIDSETGEESHVEYMGDVSDTPRVFGPFGKFRSPDLA